MDYKKPTSNIMKEFTITKKIAKQGAQMMIVIPAFLREKIKHKTLVEVKIKILEEENEFFKKNK